MHRMMCVQDLSAVTAACLMVRKDVFAKVGGLREELAVAFNDIDLCMKIRQAGYLVVYDPYSVWHHYESKSRGSDVTAEASEENANRYNMESELFRSKWAAVLEKGDPYYNENFSLDYSNYVLKGNPQAMVQ